jgi:hypothetical protein
MQFIVTITVNCQTHMKHSYTAYQNENFLTVTADGMYTYQRASDD